MKATTFICIFLFFALPALAAPKLINYQGSLSDSDGKPVNGFVAITFKLFDADIDGTELWNETQSITVTSGIYNVLLGSVTELPPSLFSTDERWLEIVIETETLSPRQQLTSVPYAFRASIADNVVTPVESCTGNSQVLQWDGSSWICTSLSQITQSSGQSNGFEANDDWGTSWDGISRGKKTWSEAKAACEADGGRLPTATELYRNNSSTGTGNIASMLETTDLWTSIHANSADSHVTVRLSDGAVSSSVDTVTASYRCIWSTPTDSFSGNDCFGPAGSECTSSGFTENVDSYDRPAMNYASASNECSSYGASILTVRDYQELIHAGALAGGNNTWLWASDAKFWGSASYGLSLVKWTGLGTESWGYTSGGSTTGSIQSSDSSYAFRCIGSDNSSGNLPTASCNGGCFQTDARRSTLLADSNDRTAATYASASEFCRLAGGRLPEQGEFSELIHAGLPNGTGVPLWSSDPVTWSSNVYGYAQFKFSGTGSKDWSPSNATMNINTATNTSAYRCVWHERLEEEMTTCSPQEKQIWSGTGFNCQPAAVGDSGHPIEFVDAWGNAWDVEEQGSMDYALAAQHCQNRGGRLPTPTELYRVRFGNEIGNGGELGEEDTYLWTLISGTASGMRITTRLSDGDSEQTAESSTSDFRCVWPVEKGDVFGSASCYGESDAPCFLIDDIRMDNLDRAPMPQPSAAQECAFFGGRLPDAGELLELIHAGAPNGTNIWNWFSAPIYGVSPAYAVARWNGTGSSSWQYIAGSGSYATYSGEYPFRCIYSNVLD